MIEKINKKLKKATNRIDFEENLGSVMSSDLIKSIASGETFRQDGCWNVYLFERERVKKKKKTKKKNQKKKK